MMDIKEGLPIWFIKVLIKSGINSGIDIGSNNETKHNEQLAEELHK